MKLYTKTGDAGETSLLSGKRVSKSCIEMQVVGAIDELNTILGLVICHSEQSEESLSIFITSIQRDLFAVGSELASLQTPLADKMQKINEEKIIDLEKKIDELCAPLPPLDNFILPGGCLAGAHLHLARVVCRRAERELVGFGKTIPIRSELYKYFNRLSDFLFAAARFVNYQSGAEEKKVF